MRPFGGVAIVLRRELRGRPLRRQLLGVGAISAAVAGLAAALRPVMVGPGPGASAGMTGTLHTWLTLWAMAAVLLLLPLAAILGETAVPTREAEAQTQSALLTNLRAWDLGTGRLLAALLPLFVVVAGSCAFWMGTQAAYPGVVRQPGAAAAIALAHLVVLCGVAMAAAVSLLFGLRRRPGRATGRGMAAGVALAAVTVGAILAATPLAERANDPSRLLCAALAVNPVYAVEIALRRDILRAPWVYDHTPAADYEIAPPPPLASAGLYAAIGLAALTLATARLRRAYR